MFIFKWALVVLGAMTIILYGVVTGIIFLVTATIAGLILAVMSDAYASNDPFAFEPYILYQQFLRYLSKFITGD